MQRLVFAALIWALVALTGPSSLVAQNLGVKFPVPDEAARKQAQARLREVYGDEHAQAKSPEEKAALAAKLLSKGEQTTDDPASCFALFAAARDLAAQVGQADVAFRAIDKMGERFAFDALTAKVEAVRKLAASCTSSKQFVSLATLADELVGELSAADRFEEAAEILQTALAAAKESNNRDLLKQVQAHAKQVDAASRAYEPVKEVFALLEKKPADAEANLAAGKYLCFVKGDWDKGVSMLALGSDETLGKVARQDLEGASDAEAQAALGDIWWKLADKETGPAKRPLQTRAGYWYQSALPQLSGLAKEAVAKRLAEIDQAKPSATASSRDSARIAKGLAGQYLALAAHRKSKEQKAAAWELRADGSLAEENIQVGTWTVSDSQIVIKFNDATRASATIRLKKKDPFLGTITFQDGETWTCELRRAMVIAYWQHQVGSSPSVKLRFWSNGYVDYANGLAFWRKSGTKLTLQWPNGDIDSCSFSSSGRFYTGRNKRGERVHGVRSDQ